MTAGRRASAAASSSLTCSGGGGGRQCPIDVGTRREGRAERQGGSRIAGGHAGGRAGGQEMGAAAGRPATPTSASPPPIPHLLDVLAIVVVNSPVRCSQALPHPSSSNAAFMGDGLLKGGGTAGIADCLSLQGRSTQSFRHYASSTLMQLSGMRTSASSFWWQEHPGLAARSCRAAPPQAGRPTLPPVNSPAASCDTSRAAAPRPAAPPACGALC